MNTGGCYEVYAEVHFSSAHRLTEYRGKCENLHGHNWRVGVAVRSRRLNREGMVVDFLELKSLASGVVGGLDHRYLNDLPAFRTRQPTAEHIARYIFGRLVTALRGRCEEMEITVWETPIQYAKYTGRVGQ